jgi:hypothetical protein
MSGPHWKTSPRTSSVGTPMETAFLAEAARKLVSVRKNPWRRTTS